eukprot:COSAG02_NODE_4131_length_5739_cov_5.860993_1_plen_45_part_10
MNASFGVESPRHQGYVEHETLVGQEGGLVELSLTVSGNGLVELSL